MKRIALASLIALFVGPACAGNLPKGAVPVPGPELRKVYAGKSAIWANKDGAYFASNGKVKMVFTNYNDGKDRWTGYGSGTWSVKGNQVCWNVSGAGMAASSGAVEPFANHVACWEWFKAGSKYYTRWSQKWRAGANSSSGYKTSAMSDFRNGDAVSGWYAAYRSKLKR